MTRLLTAHEAARGIYVDFEGRTDMPPVLLGILEIEPYGEIVLEQVVLDPTFGPAAQARSLRVMSIPAVIEKLVTRAESEDRPIIGWSSHEIEVVDRHCPGPLAARFGELYVDAKAAAKVARRRSGLPLPPPRGREKGHALARYLKLLGHEVPFPYGPGWTGETIRVLEGAFARHGSWSALTGHQKRRWSYLLSHNRVDCEGTRDVALCATAVLEGDTRAAA